MMQAVSLSRRLAAEFLGTAFLLAIVVGSGIMAERLSGDTGAALLANAIATGAGLYALILMFSNISGAHFNPVVSIAEAIHGRLTTSALLGYIAVQIIGAVAGVLAAHMMFDLPLITYSEHSRTGISQWWSEGVATFGLLAVILSTSKFRPESTPAAVALYITSAYWFTASTSFANPAVTLARSLTNTFAGIRPVDTSGFIVMQILGMLVAVFIFKWLLTAKPNSLDK